MNMIKYLLKNRTIKKQPETIQIKTTLTNNYYGFVIFIDYEQALEYFQSFVSGAKTLTIYTETSIFSEKKLKKLAKKYKIIIKYRA